MINNKTDRELRDMFIVNLASKVSPDEVQKIWKSILPFAKNRTEKMRVKKYWEKLQKKYSVPHPLIKELDKKILGTETQKLHPE